MGDCTVRAGDWRGNGAVIDSSFTRIIPRGELLWQAIRIWIFPRERKTVYLNRLAGNEPMRYAIVIEKSDTGYGAYVPDLPGCVAVGETLGETSRLIKEAIEFHLEGMRDDGLAAPAPTSVADYVEV